MTQTRKPGTQSTSGANVVCVLRRGANDLRRVGVPHGFSHRRVLVHCRTLDQVPDAAENTRRDSQEGRSRGRKGHGSSAQRGVAVIPPLSTLSCPRDRGAETRFLLTLETIVRAPNYILGSKECGFC